MFKPLKTETIQALLDEARYLDTKPSEAHDMRMWVCGTTSCAVGDMISRGVLGLKEGYLHPYLESGEASWGAVEAALGISLEEGMFLFDAVNYRRHRHRATEAPSKTAARIRKYLYYRMRKAEILADYEAARHTEGNWNVCPQAMDYAGAK